MNDLTTQPFYESFEEARQNGPDYNYYVDLPTFTRYFNYLTAPKGEMFTVNARTPLNLLVLLQETEGLRYKDINILRQ